MQEDPNHVAIVEVLSIAKGNLTIEKIKALAQENPNLFFDFYEMEDFKAAARDAEERKYMYHFPVHTYMEVRYLMSFSGLSAIVLGEPLNMDLMNVALLIHSDLERGIQIRVIPALGRPSAFNDFEGDTGITHFWILPQHMRLYAPYIDAIDLLDENLVRETALCKAYLSNEPYELSIKYLFKNMDADVLGAFVDEGWVKKRQTCQRRCLMHGPHCHKCEREEQMFNAIKEHPHFLERALNKKEEEDEEAHAYTNLYDTTY